MGDAIFKIPTPLMLDKIVTAIDGIYEMMEQLKTFDRKDVNAKDADKKGDVYEYLLYKLETAGVNGQFRTPRHIIEMIVAMMEPGPDDTIYNNIQGYMDGKISREAFWELAKFKHPTQQISFHTISALMTLKFLRGEQVHEE